jgi:hypothetical protein
LGNRNELLVAALGGSLWYYSLGGRFKFVPVLAVAVIGFVILRLIENMRGLGLSVVTGSFGEVLTSADFWNPFDLAGSSESLAAQMAMYGILARGLDLTYGSSVLYLVNSIVPRAFLSERVSDSYTVYADAMGAPDTQGFTIHYAAGWYLNFGLIGIVVGAVVLGLIWGAPLRLLARRRAMSVPGRLGILCAFCFCSAFIPALMRNGPEGLKSLFIEALVLPYSLTWFAAREITRGSTLGD